MPQEFNSANFPQITSNPDLHVLCIDDDPDFLVSMQYQLKRFCRCSTAESLNEGMRLIQKETVDVVLLDIGLGVENGIEGLKMIKREDPSIDVVMVTGQRDPKLVIESVRAGAFDYLVKPPNFEELVLLLEKLNRTRKIQCCHDALIADLNAQSRTAGMIGVSDSFRDVLSKADRIKGYQANTLIEGENGTGKELLARYVHDLEGDLRRPFIAVNCASIPETLIESELFGHEKGAFTGAIARKIGKFEMANGGDIFLDEISSLGPELQAKLLRVLQEREVVRVGGLHPIKVDFRVLSATNENIEELVAAGKFRLDLFHRLRVVYLRVPPLRERVEDIGLLVTHFLKKYSRHAVPKEMTGTAVEVLKKYAWPGNIRELENLVHNLIIMSSGDIINHKELPDWVKPKPQISTTSPHEWIDNCHEMPLKECLKRVEKLYLEKLLDQTKGNKSKAAEMLDISRTTLHSRINELGIII